MDPDHSTTAGYDAVIIGAGFSGIYQLHRLRRLGKRVVALEAGDGVGGTWYWNRYPGARVDSPSMQYSLSFSPEMEQEWHWPEDYSAQPDLERYANHVVDRFDLRRDIRFATTVVGAVYDEPARRWQVETDTGEVLSATYLVSAVGTLNTMNLPGVPGLDTFGGRWVHTSRFPDGGLDLAGKRVGVVGTGSTGIQVIPSVAEQAERLVVFQRTPNYTVPSQNRPMDPDREREWKEVYPQKRESARHSVSGFAAEPRSETSALAVSDEVRNAAFENAWLRPTQGPFGLLSTFADLMVDREANETVAEFVRTKIRGRVRDPEVAELLTPTGYALGTKRIVVESGYYEAFNRDNVTLVDVRADPITEITPGGLRTASEHYDLDVLIFATGFDAMTGPLFALNLVGRGGTTLREKWADGPRTYLGLTTAGFPNLFMITAPGSPSVLSNIITSIEQHVDMVTDAITHLEGSGLDTIEATTAAEDDWTTLVGDIAGYTLYPDTDSWYLGANIPGKPRVFMPYIGGVGTYRATCEEIVADGYRGFELS